MTDKPIGLIVKLCQVMEAVDHVEKRGHTSSPGGTYDFARDVDVSSALRSELASRKVFLSSSITNVSTEVYETKSGGRGSISTVFTAHKFIDGETGETLEFTWASQGMDGQDKGVSKGATSAIKYALLKQFLIPTGEDPDENKMAPKDLPGQRTYQARQPSQNAQQPAQEPQQRPQAQPAAIGAPRADLSHTAAEATALDWSAFWAKAREMDFDQKSLHTILEIQSVKDDLAPQPLATVLQWAEQRKLKQQRPLAAVGQHERS